MNPNGLISGDTICAVSTPPGRGGIAIIRVSGPQALDIVQRRWQGKPLADAIRSIRPLDPSLPSWVRAGETSGNLPGLLDTAATRLQRSWERRTSRGMMLLEIALTLSVGLFVAFIALAILLPVLQMNQGLAPM